MNVRGMYDGCHVMYRCATLFVSGIVVCTFRDLRGKICVVLEQPHHEGHKFVTLESNVEPLSFNDNKHKVTFSKEGEKMTRGDDD